jgi:hypothetical protein
MRLLIYGMQSSGASTVAFVLAQKPDCCAFVDIWTMYAAPALPTAGPKDTLAKVVVTTAFPLALHQERFRPDRTILVLRHPVVTYRSLVGKVYRHHCGFIEEKFALLDRIFSEESRFDAVIYYEDLVYFPAETLAKISTLGWQCSVDFLECARTQAEMVAFNEAHLPSVIGRLQYGQGNYHGGQVKPEFAGLADLPDPGPISDWCPRLLAHYNDIRNRWSSRLCQPNKLRVPT